MVPSNDQLDTAFQEWLFGLAEIWDWSPQYTADHLDDYDREIQNRNTWYPKLGLLLRRNDWTILEFKGIASQCYTLNGRHDAIPLNRMLKNELMARQAIDMLVKSLSADTTEIIQRINKFIPLAVELGYKRSRDTADNAGAAYLASVLLSTLFPWKFVDYRTQRWNRFAELLGYPIPPVGKSYGEKIVWAGDFTKEISQTRTFKKYWSHQGEPFWVIAGLCWHGPEPKKPTYIEKAFPEGRLIERRHKDRERNSEIVERAKQLAYKRDPLLRCEVCGFSFVEKYGARGEQFIEAHHKTPLAELTETTRNRIDDLAMLCSNCHAMIHSKDPTLSLDELREMLQIRSN